MVFEAEALGHAFGALETGDERRPAALVVAQNDDRLDWRALFGRVMHVLQDVRP